MSQKDLMHKFNNELISPSNMHEKLKYFFSEKVLSVSTVSYTIRILSWNETKPNQEIHAGRPPNLKIDQLIIE